MDYIGLDGKKCENPVFFCKSHQVYLSEKDANEKKCFHKPTFDMISTVKCKWLLTIEEQETERKEIKERLDKAKENYKAEKIFKEN